MEGGGEETVGDTNRMADREGAELEVMAGAATTPAHTPQPWHRDSHDEASTVHPVGKERRAPRLGAARFAGVFTPGSHEKIAVGDLVIVLESASSQRGVYVEAGGELVLKFGTFFHDSWIGLPYGSKVTAQPKKNAPRGRLGYVHLLAPSPALWTATLRHRTQINFSHDIATVLLMLDVRPGKVVAECGTGSGSLSTHLCCAVAPTGFVHTYEYHAERAEVARREFERNGIDHLVEVEERDVMGQGFPEALEGGVDAVFLDVPGPHECIWSARRILKPYGRICSFSPCIEQVARACEALGKHGFTEISTVQLQLREYETRTEVQHSTVGDWLGEYVSTSSSEKKRANHEALMAKHAKKRREIKGLAEGDGEDEEVMLDKEMGGSEDAHPQIVSRRDGDASDETREGGIPAGGDKDETTGTSTAQPLQGLASVTFQKPATPEMKTHTGFLTFATAPIKRPWGAGGGGDCCKECGAPFQGDGTLVDAAPSAQEKIIQEVLDSHDKASLVFVD